MSLGSYRVCTPLHLPLWSECPPLPHSRRRGVGRDGGCRERDRRISGQCGGEISPHTSELTSPIDRPDFGHRTKHGVGHGDAKAFRLFWTKNGQDELYNPPLF